MFTRQIRSIPIVLILGSILLLLVIGACASPGEEPTHRPTYTPYPTFTPATDRCSPTDLYSVPDAWRFCCRCDSSAQYPVADSGSWRGGMVPGPSTGCRRRGPGTLRYWRLRSSD